MNSRGKLHGDILSDIKNRTSWATKHVEFYRMRHNGKARVKKPYPNAPDLHWPLIDTNIEKLKPMFFQQIVGMDTVATFVPMRQQLAAATTTAEQWFDYKIREKTNLQHEALAWIDSTLQSGRGVMKVYWDAMKKQVRYASIDPQYFIVPSYTRDLQEADLCVHVMPFSVGAYKRAGVYRSDKSTLEKITGSGAESKDPGENAMRQARQLREGITHSEDSEQIIVWEVYRHRDDGKWIVETFSPNEPDIDLREPMELVYDHGMAPFVDFPYEIKEGGWYSPRGVAEMLAPYEAALCHTWNQKHEAMQYFNKPMFRAEREVPNTMNLRFQPGAVLPYGIVPVPAAQTPVSFDQEMVMARQVAEQRVSNPDYGMGQVINTTNRRTATEIEAIGGQTQQAGDLRARMCRMALAKLYKMSWSLLLQYDKEDLQYRFLEDSLQVDPQALHEQYHIEPKGGVNEVNRQFLLQKAVQRKQVFMNSPWINQAELDRSILELDDPSLIKRVFTDPNQKGQDEAADEAKTVPSLLLGMQIPAKQGQDYATRIGVLMQVIQKAVTSQAPVPPEGQQAVLARLDQLVAGFESVDNNAGKKARQEITKYLQSVGLVPAAPTMGGQQLPG